MQLTSTCVCHRVIGLSAYSSMSAVYAMRYLVGLMSTYGYLRSRHLAKCLHTGVRLNPARTWLSSWNCTVHHKHIHWLSRGHEGPLAVDRQRSGSAEAQSSLACRRPEEIALAAEARTRRLQAVIHPMAGMRTSNGGLGVSQLSASAMVTLYTSPSSLARRAPSLPT